MSARVDVQVGVVAPTQSSTAPESGQVFLVGRAGRGPLAPTRVEGEADFAARFGPRLSGQALYDAVRLLGLEGNPARIWIVRAVGDGAAAATASLDAGKITVTAREVGEHANTWTAAWAAADQTLTVFTDGGPEHYIGTTPAGLAQAAESSKTVTVTVGATLPAADVAAVTLTGGSDDYANVGWAATLAGIPADLGVGAVVIPGVAPAAIADELGAHARDTDRLGILSLPGGDAAAAIATADGLAGAETASWLVLAWPAITLGGVTYDPAVFAAAARGRAHSTASVARAPYQIDAGQSVSGVVPAITVSDATWRQLDAARIAVIRTVAARTRLYGWPLLAPLTPTLEEGQFRDLLNHIAHQAAVVGEKYVGQTFDAHGRTLSDFTSELVGVLDVLAASGVLYARTDEDGEQIDPGYLVDTGPAVNTTAALAEGKVAAVIKVRVSPTAQFIEIRVGAGDASATL